MDKIAYRLFLFLLFFSPLAFGTVEQWSLTLMQGLTFLVVFLYLLGCILNRQPIYGTPGLLPLFLFLIYLLLQIVPLPAMIIKSLSPTAYEIYNETASIAHSSSWISFSLDKKATLQEFFRYAAYTGFYFLTVQLLTDKERLRRTVYTVIAFISILAIFALIQNFTATNKIFWLREVSGNVVVFGPYLNHNHYAGLVGMVLPMTFALFLFLKPRIRYKLPFREKVVEFFTFQKFNVYILLGFSAILITTSIVVSLSRGGLISTCLALVFLLILLNIRRKRRQKGFVLSLFILLVVLSVSWFGWGKTFERFGHIINHQGIIQDARFVFWSDSINIIKDFPVTGTGFGSFSNIYPRYRTYANKFSVLHAHNDYLELFIEGGLLGFIPVVWFLSVLFYKSYQAYVKRRERYSIYLYSGCLAGIGSILFHSVTDFNFHIGANGLYFFFIAGLMVSAINTKLRGDSSNTLLKKIEVFWIRIAAIKITMAVLITSLVFNVGILIGRRVYSSIENVYLNPQMPGSRLERIRSIAEKASYFDPLESKYYYALANLDVLRRQRSSSLENYNKSIYYNPNNGEYSQRLGRVLSWQNDPITAEKLLKIGLRKESNNPRRYKTYASWLFSQKKKVPAKINLNKALALEPTLGQKTIREYITVMLINNFSDEEILAFMSQNIKSLLGLADYWNGNGKSKKAEATYVTALSLTKNRNQIQIQDYYKVYRFYMTKGQVNRALKVALQAINHLPDNARARILAARAYSKLRITYRAIEEYKIALTINPRNEYAIKELNSLVKGIQ